MNTNTTITTPLLQGNLIHLCPINYDTDSLIESSWTHDPGFMRMMYIDPMRPLSPAQVKKKYEEIEKISDEGNRLFHFMIRSAKEQRLLGFAQIFDIFWVSAIGKIQIGIGSSHDRKKGYAREALSMLARYSFNELNLHRLSASIPEYNPDAQALFINAGFQEEVRRRKSLERDGRRWDLVSYGILRQDWQLRTQTG